MSRENSACLIVMAKPPLLAKVKTRLAKGIGDHAALEVYRILLEHTMEVASTGDLLVSVFVTENDGYFDNHGFPVSLQSAGDLGNKMDLASRQMLNQVRKVIIIGTDCPDLSHHHIEKANNLLDSHDIVFGPCEDGGYYLLGLKYPHKEVFEDLPWSTDSLLEITLDRCREEGISYGLLEKLADVDTLDDLKNSSLWQMVQHIL
jgi:uncharacterized protein